MERQGNRWTSELNPQIQNTAQRTTSLTPALGRGGTGGETCLAPSSPQLSGSAWSTHPTLQPLSPPALRSDALTGRKAGQRTSNEALGTVPWPLGWGSSSACPMGGSDQGSRGRTGRAQDAGLWSGDVLPGQRRPPRSLLSPDGCSVMQMEE